MLLGFEKKTIVPTLMLLTENNCNVDLITEKQNRAD